ncbi:MAG TPA: DinB family protein [Candidatus Angelobacter sp.]
MNPETSRIADQLRRAFNGEAWHGPDLHALLSDVKAKRAHAHPVAGAHSIWELVLHIEVWTGAAMRAIQGTPMPKIVGTAEDWRTVTDASEQAWSNAVQSLFKTKDELAAAIEQFPDTRLTEIVPGRKYDFYYLFHGIVQHSLYHAGQIALLKKGST